MFQFTQNASAFPTPAPKNTPAAKISIIGLPAEKNYVEKITMWANYFG